MSEWSARLSRCLSTLGETFSPNELAYLALTSKVEHAIRDKIAYQLHSDSNDRSDDLICREWKRRDLAVVRGSLPVMILELKAFYTFDICTTQRHEYGQVVAEDMKKTAEQWPNAQRLALLLATHPHCQPDESAREAIKYWNGTRRGVAHEMRLEHADSQVRSNITGCTVAASGTISCCRAFGTDVSLAYWLFEPKLEIQ